MLRRLLGTVAWAACTGAATGAAHTEAAVADAAAAAAAGQLEQSCGEDGAGAAVPVRCAGCVSSLTSGDAAAAAAACFEACAASESGGSAEGRGGGPRWCGVEDDQALFVSVADIGAKQWNPAKPSWAQLRPMLGQLAHQRWTGREQPLASARSILPLLGLIGYDVVGRPEIEQSPGAVQSLLADLTAWLHEFMLALWSAGCHHAYTKAYQLSQQARPGFWRHPLQIPTSSAALELGRQPAAGKQPTEGIYVPSAWHDPSEHPGITATLEGRWRVIEAEVEAAVRGAVENGRAAGSLYTVNAEDATLVGAGEWSELRLYNQATDEWDQTNCKLLPTTCEILQAIPELRATVGGGGADGAARLPGMVSVYRLLPGSVLVPHTGLTNVRTTLHLPLQVRRPTHGLAHILSPPLDWAV